MPKATLDSVARIARAASQEVRRLRERAGIERRFGPLSFADDVPLAEAEAAFGPLIAVLRTDRPTVS